MREAAGIMAGYWLMTGTTSCRVVLLSFLDLLKVILKMDNIRE
jgi:hypothetical protein